MREVNIAEVSGKIIEQLPKGVFLTVKEGDNVNTMTIGWGTMGVIWGKPVFIVLVRYSRYTYELIEKADSFTVSVPLGGKLADELVQCGKKSGRDVNKFKEFKLTPKDTGAVDSPIIEECDISVNCKIIYKQPLDPEMIPDEVKAQYYRDGDYHVMYFGEIVKTLVK
jgi:flavin reductase (DIM6/NTAB) family NADH-FMN oxidoreductase RutF